MSIGDNVCFKGSIVARAGHCTKVANMRGTVLVIKGSVAQVDCHGTYDNEEGNSVRWIPVANLCAWSNKLGIFVDNQ